MKKLLAFTLLMAVCSSAFAADSAKQLMDAASAKAAASGKNVLVIFHASWCGWCHKLDDFLDRTDEGKKVKGALEVVHITVLESKDHKADENAGGEELLEKLGGKGSGIPYYAILDPKGKVLATSNPNKDKPGNIGYPAAPEEIAHFMGMLKAGAPKLTASDRTAIETWLKTHKPG